MAKKVERLAKKGACLAYETLISISGDLEAKPTDRIAAAKALLDRADACRMEAARAEAARADAGRAEGADSGKLTIVLDGVPGDYLN